MIEAYADQLITILLVSLRIAPALAFAPPFTYLRVPASVRVLLGFGLSMWLVNNGDSNVLLPTDAPVVIAVISELFAGMTLALCLQLAFGAILTMGRALDFQAGFGLALLADPTLRTQMPLIGTLLAYAAAAIFFLTSGPADLLAIWAMSFERVPLGEMVPLNLTILLGYLGSVFALAFGLGGFVMLTLFLVDLTIAFMSRTLPQMNVLVLGFQIKTIALLVTLPFVFVLSGALFLRIIRFALDTTLRLF